MEVISLQARVLQGNKDVSVFESFLQSGLQLNPGPFTGDTLVSSALPSSSNPRALLTVESLTLVLLGSPANHRASGGCSD